MPIDLLELQKALIRYCYSLTESVWDAEDLAQETCLKSMNVLNGAQSHANPLAYVLRIARNTWIDQARKNRTAARIMEQLIPVETTDADATHAEIEEAFDVLFQHLSPLQRTVLLLREVYGFTSVETAGLLKTTDGAIKAALRRARSSLDLMKASCMEEKKPTLCDEDKKAFLRAYISAFRLGEVQLLLQLLQNDLIHPMATVHMVQNNSVRKNQASAKRNDCKSKAQAAA